MPDDGVSILLVDDNAATGRALAKSLICAGLGVTVCGYSNEAVDYLESKRFDSIVLDLDTIQGRSADIISFVKKSGCACQVIVMSRMDSSACALIRDESDFGLFLRKPVKMDELVEALSAKDLDDTFSGSVSGVDILEYTQFIMMSGRAVVLEIYAKNNTRGRIFIHQGRIRHATFGDLLGEPALYRCLTFRGGRFANLPWSEPERITIEKPGDFLLFEAARLRDEAQADLQEYAADA